MLSTAGEYFREVSGGGLLRAELALDGFAQAKSQFALERMDQGMVDLNSRALPAAPDALRSSAPTSSAELRETPERVVRADRAVATVVLQRRARSHRVGRTEHQRVSELSPEPPPDAGFPKRPADDDVLSPPRRVALPDCPSTRSAARPCTAPT